MNNPKPDNLEAQISAFATKKKKKKIALLVVVL